MMRRPALTKRHDGIAQVFARCFRARWSSTAPPSSWTSPVSTYVQLASEDAFEALRSQEQHKITKYSDAAREACGVVSHIRSHLLRLLRREGIWLHQHTAKRATGSVRPYQRLHGRRSGADVVANQRGNAAAVMEAPICPGSDAGNLIWGRA